VDRAGDVGARHGDAGVRSHGRLSALAGDRSRRSVDHVAGGWTMMLLTLGLLGKLGLAFMIFVVFAMVIALMLWEIGGE
jgi:hypothetical protein